jgi:hypothetical protein
MRTIQPQYPCRTNLRASRRARSKLLNGAPEYSGYGCSGVPCRA